MEAKNFIELYEAYRDFRTEAELIDEDYKGYKNYLDYLKHVNPEKWKTVVARQVAKNKEKAQANFAQMDPAVQQEKIKERLNKQISNILKTHDIVTATTYYDESKQLYKGYETPENFAKEHPEVMRDVVSAIKASGLENLNDGKKIFEDKFRIYKDRIEANAKYSKQRREHREPDEPDVQKFKQNKRDVAAQQREEICNQLAGITDPEEFSLKLFDLIHNHNLNHTKPLLKALDEQIPEDDPRKKSITAALNHSLKIKYRGKNLEDF